VSEDLVGGFGPDEWFAAFVLGVDERFDGADELGHGGEGAAADGLAGDDRKECLHEVHPVRRRRGEVQRDPRVPIEPRDDVGMLVGGGVARRRLYDYGFTVR
jgi:hypothetical protein